MRPAELGIVLTTVNPAASTAIPISVSDRTECWDVSR